MQARYVLGARGNVPLGDCGHHVHADPAALDPAVHAAAAAGEGI